MWWMINNTKERTDEGESLYWSNLLGWTDKGDADIWDGFEKQQFSLPIDGEWVEMDS